MIDLFCTDAFWTFLLGVWVGMMVVWVLWRLDIHEWATETERRELRVSSLEAELGKFRKGIPDEDNQSLV